VVLGAATGRDVENVVGLVDGLLGWCVDDPAAQPGEQAGKGGGLDEEVVGPRVQPRR
jgi:hypothetical protein